jgi:hypothetical protein
MFVLFDVFVSIMETLCALFIRHFLEATSLLNDALNGFAATFGRDHASTITARHDLARVLRGLGTSASLQGAESNVDFVAVSAKQRTLL